MTDIGTLIKQNDGKLKEREEVLITRINIAYEKAIKNAIKEFKELEQIDSKVSTAQVKKILERALNAFSEEMDRLVSPIAEATQDSYEEGLNETGQILKKLKGGIE